MAKAMAGCKEETLSSHNRAEHAEYHLSCGGDPKDLTACPECGSHLDYTETGDVKA